jgi:hypothetical protein
MMDARLGATAWSGVRLAAGGRRLAIVPVVSLVLAASPPAQASACDDYKAVLAARFESAGVRGYSLEVVPANAPVPPGAKVIATCEGGARKFLYRRWAAAGASTGAANAAAAASTVRAAAVAEAPARRVPPSAREERVPTALAASAPTAVTPPAPRSKEPAAAVAVMAATPAKPVVGSASEVAAVNPIERRVVAPPALASAGTAAETAITPTQEASGFAARYWPWIGALALLALAGGLWLWRSYFSAYDKDGLPRGPAL